MNLKKVFISLITVLFTLHVSAVCINSQPENAKVCAGSSTTFSVSAVGAFSYQWQVDTGSGFNDILVSGSGPQYDTNTWALPVLQLNNVNASFDGYQYRCIVCCGSCLTTDTSLIAILTVVATAPAQSFVITGTVNPCQNIAGLIYSVSDVSGLYYTWSLPADWTIVSGQNNDSIIVNAGISAGDIIVIPSNVCGNGPPDSLFVSPISVPAQPVVITGSTVPCQGSSQIYIVSGDTGVIYLWTFPPTWSQIAGDSTGSVTALVGADSGNIQVTPSNVCGVGLSQILAVTPATLPSQPDSITGNLSPCQGTSQNYSVSIVAGVSYLWTFPSNWSQTSGGNSNAVTANVGLGSGNIEVTPSNGCGDGLSQILAVTPAIVPSQPDSITGNPSPCQGTSQNYSVSIVTGVSYSWTFPSGWSQTLGGNSNAVTANVGSGSGNIQVTPSNGCGDGLSQILAVTPVTLPSQPGNITGNPSPCQGTSQNYSVSNETGVSYSWTFPSGWSQTSGGNSNAVTANVGSGSGNIQVTPSNGCGDGLSQILAVTPAIVPSQPDSIIGNPSPCQGTSQNYSIPDVVGVNYSWIFPSGWSQTSGGNSNAVTANVGTGSGNIQVTPSNVCGNGPSWNLAVTPLTIPSQPNTITGSSAPCQGTSQNYSVSNIAGVSYAWMFPSGWLQTSGGNSNSVMATVGGGTGNILVTPTNVCGNGPSRTLAVSPVTIPAQPNSITGNIAPCQGSSQFYSVSNVTGVSFSWTFPSGWSQTSGGNSNAVAVTAGPGSGNIQVTPSNGCGNGPSRTLAVSPVTIPAQPNSITGNTLPCQGTSQNYSVSNIAGVSYAWIFPTGWSQTSGGNSNAVTVTVGAGSGNITVTPSNACGNGLSQTLAISTATVPLQPITITGSIAPCQGTSQNYSVSNVTGVSYSWSFPSGWSQTSGGNSNAVTVTVGTGSGNIQVTPSNGCGNGLSQTLGVSAETVPSQPNTISGIITPCQSTSQNYSVINMTDVSYSWSFPSGWSQTSGGNSNAVTVTVGAGSGNITVTPSNVCGNGTSQTMAVNSLTLPVQPNTITGDVSPCQGQNGVAYYIPMINATGYTWTLPVGASIGTGSNTNSVTINFSDTSSSGIISVFGTNSCGSGDSSSLLVNLDPLPGDAANITGPALVCQGQNNLAFSIPVITNVSGYVWSFSGTGATINVTGNNVTVDFAANATSGDLMVFGNNTCGNGTAAIYSISVNPFPYPKITGDTVVCQNAYWVKYYITSQASDVIKWTISNGEFWQNGIWSSIPIIGNGINEVYVHWITMPNLLTAEQTGISGCQNSDTIEVSMDGHAPDLVTIIAKNDDIGEKILICPNGYSYYYWGYEAKSNFIETDKCSGTNWCLYDFIDTVNYYYWVKIGYDDACLVKSYFNQPMTLHIDEVSSGLRVNVFPNPFDDFINIEMENEMNKKLLVKIYTVLNDNVYAEEIVPDQDPFRYIVNIGNLKEGIYFIQISTFDGRNVVKKMIRIKN
jgi:large repetitive protein